MENKDQKPTFYKETEEMFKGKLASQRIMILDIAKDEILTNIDYDQVFFDSKLRLHKVNKKTGAIEPVYNSNFKAVIVES